MTLSILKRLKMALRLRLLFSMSMNLKRIFLDFVIIFIHKREARILQDLRQKFTMIINQYARELGILKEKG